MRAQLPQQLNHHRHCSSWARIVLRVDGRGRPSKQRGVALQAAPGTSVNSASSTAALTAHHSSETRIAETSGRTATSNSQHNVWTESWYPVAFVRDLDKSKTHRFVLLRQPLVIWWEPAAEEAARARAGRGSGEAGQWRVLKDVCPHRLVPLSEGRINEAGQLECGYHGWSFSGGGTCERIPQGGAVLPRTCVAPYACAVRQGLLWVKPKPLPLAMGPEDQAAAVAAARADEATIPIVPELEEEGWVSQDVWRDLPMDHSTLMENVLDSSHVPFTHHKSMSNRYKISDYEFRLTDKLNPGGFKGIWQTGPRAGELGPQATEFRAPGFLKHSLDARERRGFRSLTVVYAVPMEPGRCRLINRNVTRFEKTKLPGLILGMLPKWLFHVSSHVLLEDDQIFLHIGEEELIRQRLERGLTHSQACTMVSQADTYIIAYHRWLEQHAGGGPWGPLRAWAHLLPPRMGRDALLDRYWQHTAHCKQCQEGKQTVANFKRGFKAGAIAAAAASILSAAAAAFLASSTPVAPAAAAAASAAAAGGVSPLATALGSLMSALSAVVLAVAGLLSGVPLPAAAALQPATAATSAAAVQNCALRAAAWAVAALVCGHLHRQAAAYEQRFVTGVYPPPRNLD